MLYNALRYLICFFVIPFIFACDKTSVVTPSKLQQETITVDNSDNPQTNNSKLRLAFSVTEFSVGTNRVRFSLIDPESGPLRSKNVIVQIFYLEEGNQK